MQPNKQNGICQANLIAEWDNERNPERIESISCGSNKKVWWVCPKGHSYQQTVHRRVSRNNGCPYCSGHKVLVGFNDLATINPILASEWNDVKNDGLKPTDFTAGSGKRVWWKCKYGHEFQATIHDRNSDKTKCPVCNARRQTSFPEQAILYYVKKLYPDSVNKYREIFDGSMELDVFIPSIKIGIEFDGAAWHNTEEQHKREIVKYEKCRENHIKLIRVKEKTNQTWNDVADCIYEIHKVKKYEELNAVIQTILDSIDVNSNMWTRKNPYKFTSDIKVNTGRDQNEILSYLSTIENALDQIRLDVVEMWDYEANGSLAPAMFSISSNTILNWKCPKCGHTWKSSVNSMTRPGRKGCSICSKKTRVKTFVKTKVSQVGSLALVAPELAKEWHPILNGDLKPEDITVGRFKPVWWKCSTCGYEWQASPNNRKKGVGCPCCSGRVPKPGVNDLATLYPGLLVEWDYKKNQGLDPANLLPKSGKKAWWRCKHCGHEWETVIRVRTKGHGCPKCRKKRVPL